MRTYRRLTKKDIPEMPEWFERVLDHLNQALVDLYEAVGGGLRLSEHLLCEVIQTELPHDVAETVQLHRLSRNPLGGVVLYSSGGAIRDFDWSPAEEPRTVNVTVTWVTTPSANPEVTLLFFGR